MPDGAPQRFGDVQHCCKCSTLCDELALKQQIIGVAGSIVREASVGTPGREEAAAFLERVYAQYFPIPSPTGLPVPRF